MASVSAAQVDVADPAVTVEMVDTAVVMRERARREAPLASSLLSSVAASVVAVVLPHQLHRGLVHTLSLITLKETLSVQLGVI
jgi:hypothetical protein